MTALVILDSAAKARSFSEQFHGEHKVVLMRSASMKVSHIPDESKSHTGRSVFQVVPAEGELAFAKELLNNLHKDIYIALESDQKGEYWSWMLSRFVHDASKGRKETRRIRIMGFHDAEINEAFRLIEPVGDETGVMFYARMHFDGYLARHLIRLLGTDRGPAGMPLNFTSLTTFFLLEERAAEARVTFAPPKWEINVRVSTPDGTGTVRMTEAFGISDDGVFKNEEQLKKALSLFAGKLLVVKRVGASDMSVDPPMPYSFVGLLHDAHIHLGMEPIKVSGIVSKLYAGLAIKDGHAGLVTAPFGLAPMQDTICLSRIKNEVARIYGSGELIERDPRGHVILPLYPGIAGDQFSDVLSAEEQRLYELIRCRALASQMPVAKGENFFMECQAGGGLFRGRAPFLTQLGFLKVFDKGYERYLVHDCFLRNLQVGQELRVEQVAPTQSAGLQAKHYTYESFSEDLREFSAPLDDPSCILLLQEMLDKGYVSIDPSGYLHMEANTARVVSTLNRAFPGMKGISFSAYFDQTVREVVSGRKSFDSALKQFDQTCIMHGVPLVRVHVPKALPIRGIQSKNIIRSRAAKGAGPESSPEFPAEVLTEGNNLSETLSESVEIIAGEKEKKFFVLPDSDKKEVPGKTEETGMPHVEEAPHKVYAPIEEIVSPDATSAQEEIAADEFAEETLDSQKPETSEDARTAVFEKICPSAEEYALPVVEKSLPAVIASKQKGEAVQQVRICPDCGKQMLLKSDRFDKYWSCMGYPACRHSESHEPHRQELDIPCPLCGKSSLVAKRTPTGKKLYVCPREGCEFMAWSRPHAIACPGCGSPFLVEKTTAAGQLVFRCPRAGCCYVQASDGAYLDNGDWEDKSPVRKKNLVRRPSGSGGGNGSRKVLVRRKKN